MKIGFAFTFLLLTATWIPISVLSTIDEKELEQYTFDKFISDFNKVYHDKEEYRKRSDIFYNKLEHILSFNRAPGKTYRLGINIFSDRTDEEFSAQFSGELANTDFEELPDDLMRSKADEDIPEEMSWQDTTPPVLTPIKAQGDCASSWAHAAIEEVESMYAIATGKLLSLSSQQVVSCADNQSHYDSIGDCHEGTVQMAWKYINSTGGIVSDKAYPYQNEATNQTEMCKLNNTMTKEVTVERIVTISSNNYDVTIAALVKRGPLAVRVDASKWKDYKNGIFNECGANGENITINHAAQLVGYGIDNATNTSYWIVRNSWGEDWGEKGFIRLLRETGNYIPCYVNDWNTGDRGSASDSNVAVTACGMCGILYDVSYPVVGTPSNDDDDPTKYAWVAGVVFGALGLLMIILVIHSKCRCKRKGRDVYLLDESESLDLNS